MTEEIKYNKDEKWIPYKQLAETPQQTITRLEQENKELKEKLDKEEYNACCECTNIQNQNDKYKSALKEIRKIAKGISKSTIDTYPYGGDEKTWEAEEAERILEKITEVLQCE